jgi:MFS family permease
VTAVYKLQSVARRSLEALGQADSNGRILGPQDSGVARELGPLVPNPPARGRRDDDQLPRSHGARDRRALPDEGARPDRRGDGVVFSAFSWSYALLQIPGGIFLDRYGTRLTYSLALSLWSCFTAAMGLVHNLTALGLTRIGLGIFEAPCFPANSRVLATWFPQHERARANSIYSVGQYAGIAFLSVPLFWITQQLGWRGLFSSLKGFGVGIVRLCSVFSVDGTGVAPVSIASAGCPQRCATS